MITLFENFENDNIKLPSYIKKSDNNYVMPSVSFEHFGEFFIKNTNPKYYIKVQYNSLMRYFLYLKLLRYKGDSQTILKYIEGIKNKDQKRIEIISKIPNNNGVRNMINYNFNLNYDSYNYDNLPELLKFIDNIKLILDDRNLIEYINIVYEVSKKADKSEKIVRGMLNMLYGKYCEIIHAKSMEDKAGVDIWKIDKITGIRQGIQVKNITGNVTFNIIDNNIYINNTILDLNNYDSWKDEKIHYDYLCFYLENDKKICLIKSTAISTIEKEKRSIRIKLQKWGMDPKFRNYVLKLVDIPKKFLAKDTSKIFYTPEIEQEVKNINPNFNIKD
jgi:hypothetical protein